MRKIGFAAIALGALAFATPALAGPGQCYDAYGRPVGPVYDTDYPNYNFINAVIRRGGSCTGVQPYYNPYGNRYYDQQYYYDRRYNRYYPYNRYYDYYSR
jgi:hypothetical protein